MARDTFQDCEVCINSVGAALDGYSVDIVKVVLLALLRDTLVAESTSREMLFQRADQVADYIKTSGYDRGDVSEWGQHG